MLLGAHLIHNLLWMYEENSVFVVFTTFYCLAKVKGTSFKQIIMGHPLITSKLLHWLGDLIVQVWCGVFDIAYMTTDKLFTT